MAPNSHSFHITNVKVLKISIILSFRGVPEVTMAGFCLKFARYALYMWLPLFLTEHLNYSLMDAGIISCAFDIGGAIGGPLLGYYIDNTEEK